MTEFGLWLSLGGIILLLLLSALFSMSETGMTASSEARIGFLANQGNKSAKRVQKLLAQRDKLISSILLGNNAVNILASSLATSALIGLFGDVGVAYATVAMTILVLIFGEVMPKTYAINRP